MAVRAGQEWRKEAMRLARDLRAEDPTITQFAIVQRVRDGVEGAPYGGGLEKCIRRWEKDGDLPRALKPPATPAAFNEDEPLGAPTLVKGYWAPRRSGLTSRTC